MAQPSIAKVTGEVVDLLAPLSSEERGRVITASLALLGETNVIKSRSFAMEETTVGEGALPLSGKGVLWMKQNGVRASQLLEVFHFDKGTAGIIIGDMPGANTKEKVRNAYMLLGLSTYLTSGNSAVDDKIGRSLCERFGIYDHTNHAKAFKGGNELTGSSRNGWTVTAPGLRHAAVLVKQASKSDD